MTVKVCEQFAVAAKLSPGELSALKALVASDPSMGEKLGEHLAYLAKRPAVAEVLANQWRAKLPASAALAPAATNAPPTLSAPPPVIQQTEIFSHAAINGAAVAGSWTMESAAQAGASQVWRAGLAGWIPCDKLSVQPAAQPIVPTIDGFPIPWPDSVELAKNGKLYANLRGSLKPIGKGRIGIELSMLKALLGEDASYRKAILAELAKLGG